MPPTPVNVDNFVRAETNRMFHDLVATAGLNEWQHGREPTPVDKQTVIRMNRDTLYSFAVVDLAGGASVTLPDAGDRYVSVMVVNQDHYINRIFHDAGTYPLTEAEFDTRYVVLAARVLADPSDADDMAAAHRTQDGLALSAESAEPFVMPEYDEKTFEAARGALLELAALPADVTRTFGSRDSVDPIHHLIGTAFGWGGLPESEAVYVSVSPGLPVGKYRIDVGEVPVDAFWSVTIYNADGFFEPNDRGVYSVNSVTGAKNADGTMTIHLGPGPSDEPNFVPITEGWNYLARLYRPRPPILDGGWTFPSVTPG
jgi:hypothetical protein